MIYNFLFYKGTYLYNFSLMSRQKSEVLGRNWCILTDHNTMHLQPL